MNRAKEILKAVAEVYGIDENELMQKTRKRNIAEARQLFRYFLREKLGFTCYKIGKITLCNHSTVTYSIKVVKALKETDRAFRQRFNEIKERIDREFNVFLIH